MLVADLKIPMKPQEVGIAWYSMENYLSLRLLFEDGYKLHPTFGERREAALCKKESNKMVQSFTTSILIPRNLLLAVRRKDGFEC
jgi:hypothetical protein